ncbi:hypothetical protein M406DRAFT_31150, partial [Cryphonectria parasitica EP155]
RQHSLEYHRPLLLHGELGSRGRSALLDWYDGVSTDRLMPWRKPFIDVKDYDNAAELQRALTQRAYEVFISEIMLQQTRVKVVIDYWNRWMEKWPTIYDLAKADEDDVMSAWTGLGYYSRCKRILEACRKVVRHPDWCGLMPQDAKTLEKEIPGVGPYTAGALSSIVFGRPAPMVDGNVLRVLSRQLGVLGDIKNDKTIIGLIWACASALVETEVGEVQPNDGPGRWGQALMELGSTVCTPQPNCSICPITMTCRAYEEGSTLSEAGLPRRSVIKTSQPVEIEDLCRLCEPFETAATDHAAQKSAFPVKVVKKALREQETLVCAIQRASDGMYLLQKRPNKGLLAGMWEFPSQILAEANDSTAASRKRSARNFVTDLFDLGDSSAAGRKQSLILEYRGELGSVPWVFSHLKLTMHVHLFRLKNGQQETPVAHAQDENPRRWATSAAVEGETMGTGMRQCW